MQEFNSQGIDTQTKQNIFVKIVPRVASGLLWIKKKSHQTSTNAQTTQYSNSNQTNKSKGIIFGYLQ